MLCLIEHPSHARTELYITKCHADIVKFVHRFSSKMHKPHNDAASNHLKMPPTLAPAPKHRERLSLSFIALMKACSMQHYPVSPHRLEPPVVLSQQFDHSHQFSWCGCGKRF